MSQPRTIAIGDIHGCSAALNAILDVVQPGAEDRVVTLGDYINRGPDSRGVLETLMSLKARTRLTPILGNHDQILLGVRSGKYPIYWLLDMGGSATLDSYGASRDISAIPDEHIAFLESCLDFHEDERRIYIHANYEADLAMAEQHVRMLRWESLRDSIPAPHVSGKTVIAGHTAQKTGEILDLGHITCIDTFCYGNGWLTAFDVDSRQVWQASKKGKLRKNL